MSARPDGLGIKAAEAARAFAREKHATQMYGEHPFTYHLERVVGQLRKYGHEYDCLLAAGWLHDVVEDTPVTMQELADEFGTSVSLRVDAVTDVLVGPDGEALKNRRARQALTYAKLRRISATYPDVIELKLADRLANMEASLDGVNVQHLSMYLTEHPYFCRQIGQCGGDAKMWDRLDHLVRSGYKAYHAVK